MIVKTELKTVRVPHNDAVFIMRQLDTSQLTEVAVIGQNEGPGRAVEETFVFALREWEGVQDENGPLECDDINKRKVFAANHDLVDVLLNGFQELVDEREEAEKKILNSGQNGT